MIYQKIFGFLFFILLALLTFSCTDDIGSLGEKCYTNSTCNDGLECKDNICIKLELSCTPSCQEWQSCDNGSCNTSKDRCKDDNDCSDGKKCDDSHNCRDSLCFNVICDYYWFECNEENGRCDKLLDGYCADNSDCIDNKVCNAAHNCIENNTECTPSCQEWESCNSGSCELSDGRCIANSNCTDDKICDETHNCIIDTSLCIPNCQDWQVCNNGACDTLSGRCLDNEDCNEDKICNDTHNCEYRYPLEQCFDKAMLTLDASNRSVMNRFSELRMQDDGNLVFYYIADDPYEVLWQTATRTTNGVLIFQDDGNLVLYEGNRALWHTYTAGEGDKFCVGFRKLTIYDSSNNIIWSKPDNSSCSNCQDWQFCDNGECRTFPDRCLDDSNCSNNTICDSSHNCSAPCTPSCQEWESCNGGSCELSDNRCVTDNDCEDGKTCNLSHSCVVRSLCEPACEVWQTCNEENRTCVNIPLSNFNSDNGVGYKFGVYEVVLNGNGSVSNPFDINCSVTFTPQIGNSVTVDAFYDGGNTWRARVYLTEIGNWNWSSNSSDSLLNSSGSFNVVESNSLRGMLKPNSRNPHLWMTDNNKTFINIADTAYTLFSSERTKSEMLLGSSGGDNYTTETEFENFVREEKSLGITSMRALMFGRIVGDVNIPWNDYFEGGNKDKFNLFNFQHTDNRMKRLLNEYPDIYIQLILFPGGYLGSGGCSYWGSNLTSSQRIKLMKYIIARFAAYPNKFWSGSNDNYIATNGQPANTWAMAREIGNYFKDNDIWHHLMAFGHRRDDIYPFKNEVWSTYIIGYTQYDLAAELMDYRGYNSINKHVYNTEDYYETYHQPAHPDYFFRRFMWSYLLNHASATYSQEWNYIQPYSEGNFVGLNTNSFITKFFNDRNIDIALFTPNDAWATQVNAPGPEGNSGPSRPQCMNKGNDEIIIYIPNALSGEKAGFNEGYSIGNEDTRKNASLDSSKIPEVSINLTSTTAQDSYGVLWYRVKTGDILNGSNIIGGGYQVVTSPWQGEDVVLYLTRN